jgi:hypothetical protein
VGVASSRLALGRWISVQTIKDEPGRQHNHRYHPYDVEHMRLHAEQYSNNDWQTIPRINSRNLAITNHAT